MIHKQVPPIRFRCPYYDGNRNIFGIPLPMTGYNHSLLAFAQKIFQNFCALFTSTVYKYCLRQLGRTAKTPDFMGLYTTSCFYDRSMKIRNRSTYLRIGSIKIRQITDFCSIYSFSGLHKCVKIWTHKAKKQQRITAAVLRS